MRDYCVSCTTTLKWRQGPRVVGGSLKKSPLASVELGLFCLRLLFLLRGEFLLPPFLLEVFQFLNHHVSDAKFGVDGLLELERNVKWLAFDLVFRVVQVLKVDVFQTPM